MTEAFLKEADNLRFQLGRLLRGAEVLGDSMDAPVKLAMPQAVVYGSIQKFLARYDEARALLKDGER